jgi:hypothetical protein
MKFLEWLTPFLRAMLGLPSSDYQVVNARWSPIVPSELLTEPVAVLLERCCSYMPGDRPTAQQVMKCWAEKKNKFHSEKNKKKNKNRQKRNKKRAPSSLAKLRGS